ncbi:MAG: hypothetical protein WAS27_03725 [Candidatus Saccharimonadales bacterium]
MSPSHRHETYKQQRILLSNLAIATAEPLIKDFVADIRTAYDTRATIDQDTSLAEWLLAKKSFRHVLSRAILPYYKREFSMLATTIDLMSRHDSIPGYRYLSDMVMKCLGVPQVAVNIDTRSFYPA